MMALERPTAENHLTRLERPETSSKFSRNSKRSDFHMSYTDFGSSTDSLGKTQFNKKMETQTKFYNTKTKFAKAGSFGSTFYPSDRHNTQKRSDDSKESHVEPALPNIKENDIIDTKAFNQDSLLPNGEFKQGMTLDKFLGGGFKKIEIFDSNLKEFDKKETYIDDIIEERTNELSEPDDKEYQYESFEILETDDEDDISEVNQDDLNKEGHKGNPPKEQKAVQENHEVLSRIQNKYKSSKPKFLPKEKPKRFRARSPLKEKQETINSSNNISETEHAEPESRRRNLSSNKSESKSLSPKFGHGRNHNGKGLSFTQEAAKYAIDIPQQHNAETISVSSLLKNSSSPCHTASNTAMQTQNSFRGTRSQFNVTNENFKGGNEKPRTTLIKKSTYHNKPWIQTHSSTDYGYGEELVLDKEKQGTRSHSLAGTLKPLENASKFQNEKMSNTALEQKFMRENKMITEKIKQSEKEMMDKYAKMFKLNQHEVLKLAKDNNERKIEGPKRLSTPLKDFSASRNFQKRKIII